MADTSSNLGERLKSIGPQAASEAQEAFSRTFGETFEFVPQQTGPYDASALSDQCNGPGLGIVLGSASLKTIMVLPESSGLLPSWYKDPDATGESKLSTLGQELGATLLPDELFPDEVQAGHVACLSDSIERCGVADGAQQISYLLSTPDHQANLTMIWPVDDPQHFFSDSVDASSAPGAKSEDESTECPAEDAPSSNSEPDEPGSEASMMPSDTQHTSRLRSAKSFKELPDYTKSLLKIRVPVVVNLASTKQRVENILDLEIGSIIQFEKSCDETLTLEIGNREVGEGEAVKIGEKFGLRITSLLMPGEEFHPLQGATSETAPKGDA